MYIDLFKMSSMFEVFSGVTGSGGDIKGHDRG